MARHFAKFYTDRPETWLLPPAAFKVWMYHYSRENQTRESWPSLTTICEELDMNESTVKTARRYLLENGWLEQIGERNSTTGRFKVPVMRVRRGTIPKVADKRSKNKGPQVKKSPMDKAPDRRRKNHLWTVVKNSPMDRGEKFTTEVDPCVKKTHYEEDVFVVGRGASVNENCGDARQLGTNVVAETLGKDPLVPEVKIPPTVNLWEGQFQYCGDGRWESNAGPGRPHTNGWMQELQRRNTLKLTPEQI